MASAPEDTSKKKGKDPLAMSEIHIKAINENYEKLAAEMSLDPIMFRFKNLLTKADRAEIELETDDVKQKRRFLDIILEKPDAAYYVLVKSLESSDQEHLCAIIRKIGDRSPIADIFENINFDPEAIQKAVPSLRGVKITCVMASSTSGEVISWIDEKKEKKQPDPTPMTEAHKTAITNNYSALVQDMTILLDLFVEEKILNKDDLAQIRARKTSPEKNKKLLDIVLEKPDVAFYTLIKSLDEAGQDFLAEPLRRVDKADTDSGASPQGAQAGSFQKEKKLSSPCPAPAKQEVGEEAQAPARTSGEGDEEIAEGVSAMRGGTEESDTNG